MKKEMEYISAEGVNFTVSGDVEGWDIEFKTESEQEGLELASWQLNSQTLRHLPKLKLYFSVPQDDMQVKWHMLENLWEIHHNLPWWFDKNEYDIAHDAPVCCYMNHAGENKFTFAFSDAKRSCRISTGPHENGMVIAEMELFFAPEAKCQSTAFSVRIDRRPLHFAETLSEVSKWFEDLGYTPSPAVPVAEMPLYSTWEQYQKDVSQDELERELPLISELGMKTIILDDGWQTHLTEGGGMDMTTCGVWEPYTGKFPNLKAHVEKFHNSGIKYIIWLSLAFAGKNSGKLYERFRGKFLAEGNCCIFDPRYPEVRDYLIETISRVARDLNLDGMKLDFIDSFRLPDEDLAAKNNYAGCDFISLPDAIERLLSELVSKLKALKPNIMLEFRQHYNGPAMRQYGNIFRASDCAFDCIQNKVRVTDLRLMSGKTTVHSDMAIWSPAESPETAALQILNVLFGVPQISMRLQELSAEHRRMLKFWLKFWYEHKETLLRGKFRPESPEYSYPLISALGKDENIIAVYEPGKLIEITSAEKTYLINATRSAETGISLPSNAKISIYNVFGEEISQIKLAQGLHRLSIPESGYAKLLL